MSELLRGMARLLGIMRYTQRVFEDAVKDTLLEIVKNIGGDAMLKIIYSFPEPRNNAADELAALRLGNLEEVCGGRIDVDCLLKILGVGYGGEADTGSREQAEGG